MPNRSRVNKFALQGECEVCGCAMFKLLKNQNYQYLVSTEPLEDNITTDNFEILNVIDEQYPNESLIDKIEQLQSLKGDLSIAPETRRYLKIQYEGRCK